MKRFILLYLVTVVTGEGSGPVISIVQRTGATTTMSCLLPNATMGKSSFYHPGGGRDHAEFSDFLVIWVVI